MASMYDRIVNVITKPAANRTQAQVELLLPWFRKKSELFQSLKTDVITDILKNCEFSRVLRDHPIIKQGERGDCFYILLRGTVAIFINGAISDEDDEEKIAQYYTKEHIYSDKGELDRSKFGHYIAALDVGKSFGELALINKNCVRNASIIADETTDLLIVNRVLYNRCLHAAQAAEFEQRTTFVATNPLFASWQARYRRQMAMSLRKMVLPFERAIVRQGDPVTALYFLLKGQAKIVIDPAQHQMQYPQFYPLEDPDEILAREELEDDILYIPRKKKEQPLSNLCAPIQIHPYAQRRREVMRKTIEVSIVGNNEIIGDTEYALDLKTYLQTVTSTQPCEIYALDMKNYERLVVRRNPKSIEHLRVCSATKLSARLERYHDNQMPLLRTLVFRMCHGDRQQRRRRREMAAAVRQQREAADACSASGDIFPQRGPLIDMYGPGTVYHRIKMREKSMQRLRDRANHFRGATTVGFGIMPSAMFETNPEIRHSDISLSVHVPVQAPRDEDSSGNMSADGGDDDDDYTTDSEHETGGPKCPPVPPPWDWDSNNDALTVLEERINAWHHEVGDRSTKRQQGPAAVPLRRVTIEEGKTVMPGTRVCLRRRKPPSPVDDPDNAVGEYSDNNLATNRSTMYRQRTMPVSVGCPNVKESTSVNAGEPRPQEQTPRQRAHSKFPFRLHKKPHKRQYTVTEYQALRKLMLSRQRSISYLGVI